jgi:hypothetical protein
LRNEQFTGAKPKSEGPVRKRRRIRVIPIVLLIIVLVAAIIYYDSNTRLVITEYELGFATLPEAFDGYRIVVLADIHGVEHGENNVRLIEAVKTAQPDIIVIAGDLIDRFQAGKPVERQLEIAEVLVSELTLVAPVFYITGNHEWDSGMIRPLLAMLDGRGVQILRNRYVRLELGGESIILAGVDDPNGPADMIKPDEFIEGIYDREGEGFVVVLSHRNYNLRMYSDLGVDLVLSGHAHGGMVRLPFTDGLIGPQYDLFPTYTSGVYSRDETDMVVSRGLGNHFGWTRFLNNPEVVVVELNLTTT